MRKSVLFPIGCPVTVTAEGPLSRDNYPVVVNGDSLLWAIGVWLAHILERTVMK